MKKSGEDLAKSSTNTTGSYEILDLDFSESDPELEALAACLEATVPEDLMGLDSRESLRSDLLKTFTERFRTDL